MHVFLIIQLWYEIALRSDIRDNERVFALSQVASIVCKAIEGVISLIELF